MGVNATEEEGECQKDYAQNNSVPQIFVGCLLHTVEAGRTNIKRLRKHSSCPQQEYNGTWQRSPRNFLGKSVAHLPNIKQSFRVMVLNRGRFYLPLGQFRLSQSGKECGEACEEAFSRYRPGMLLIMLQCTGQPPPQGLIQSLSAEVKETKFRAKAA